MKKCWQHRVAEQRFHALAVALLIMRQCVLLVGRKRLVCARRRPIIQVLVLEKRASHMSMRLASRCSQARARCIGRAVGSGHAHHWELSIGNVLRISRQRAPKGGHCTMRFAWRRRNTKAHALLQVHSVTIRTVKKALLQRHVAHLGPAGVDVGWRVAFLVALRTSVAL